MDAQFFVTMTGLIANDKVYPGGMLTFIRYVDLERLFE